MIDLGPPPLVFPTPQIIRPVEGGLWGSLDGEMVRLGLSRGQRRAVLAELRRTVGTRDQAVSARAVGDWTGLPLLGATLAAKLRTVGSGGAFESYSTDYTTAGGQTISIPAGASTVTIVCIGGGGGSSYFYDDHDHFQGGGGGAYSAKNTYSVSGLSGIYIYVGAAGPAVHSLANAGGDSYAKENSSGGTTICFAQGGQSGTTGGNAASGTGDVKYSGGNGVDAFQRYIGAGGAGGPSGNGSTGSGNNGGASGGSPGGAGGGQNNGQGAGLAYGGGGAWYNYAHYAGSVGIVRLTWE